MSTPPSGSVSHFFPFSFFFYDGIIKFMKRLYCILLAGFLLLLSFTPGISAADSDDVSFALRSEYKADHSRFLFSAESSAKDITSSCKLTVTGKHPNASVILHSKYLDSFVEFNPGEYMQLTWKEGVSAHMLCLQWIRLPIDATIRFFGADGVILSEQPVSPFYDTVNEIPSEALSLQLIAGNSGMTLGHVQVFSEGRLPEPFFFWQPTPDNLDYLLVATHPDDDTLFLGAVIPILGAEQGHTGTVAFMTASKRERISEAERGVWTMGSPYYPIFLGFPDIPQTERKDGEKQFQTDTLVAALVKLFRKHKPLVVFTQDAKGEYGHWQHMRVSAAVVEASKRCADPSYDPSSADEYGVWEVKKCYVHLYKDNPLIFDIDTPLASMDGKTAFQIAKEAFAKHESQQSGRHHVNGVNENFSIAKFGMAYGTVEAGDEAFMNIDLSAVSQSEETPAPSASSEPSPIPTETPDPEPEPTPVPDNPSPILVTPEPSDTPEPSPAFSSEPTSTPELSPKSAKPSSEPTQGTSTSDSISNTLIIGLFITAAILTVVIAICLIFLKRKR